MGKTIKLPFNDSSVVSVGWTGQNAYEEVTFDISAWLKRFPTGVVRVFYKLNTDGNLYPIADITSNTYIWKPQAADFPKPGRYSAQAIMESGTTIGKSDIFYFDIKKSLDHLNQISDDPPPEYPPSYIQKIMQDMEAYAQRAESAAEHIPYYEDGKLYVWDEDTQQFVEFSLDIDDAVEKYFDKHPIKFTETDPTVPAWAKQPQKPTYTANEVGALPADTPIPAAVTVDDALSSISENPVQNKVINAALQSKGTYSKPSTGIPKTDLASDVQEVLDGAITGRTFASYLSDEATTVFTLLVSGTTVTLNTSFINVYYSYASARGVVFVIQIGGTADAPDVLFLRPTCFNATAFSVTLIGEHNGNRYSVTLSAASATASPMTGTLTVEPLAELPTVSSTDNGKFLRVVNGAWAAATVPSAESNSFGGGS